MPIKIQILWLGKEGHAELACGFTCGSGYTKAAADTRHLHLPGCSWWEPFLCKHTLDFEDRQELCGLGLTVVCPLVTRSYNGLCVYPPLNPIPLEIGLWFTYSGNAWPWMNAWMYKSIHECASMYKMLHCVKISECGGNLEQGCMQPSPVRDKDFY